MTATEKAAETTQPAATPHQPEVTAAPVIELPLAQVIVGERIRKDLGDLGDLTDSLRELGILNPLTLGPGNQLIAGQRRLKVAEALGWETVPCRVFPTFAEGSLAAAKAEHDENQCRKDFTPSEAAAWLKANKPRLDAEGQARRLAASAHGAKGGRPKRGENPAPKKGARKNKHAGEALAVAGKVTGMSRGKLAGAVEVTEAAEKDPTLSDVVAEMDRTGKVAPAVEEVRRRQGKDKVSKAKPARKPLSVAAVRDHINALDLNDRVELVEVMFGKCPEDVTRLRLSIPQLEMHAGRLPSNDIARFVAMLLMLLARRQPRKKKFDLRRGGTGFRFAVTVTKRPS
jgi:ParB-like chromosome segregation protein Spo0J